MAAQKPLGQSIPSGKHAGKRAVHFQASIDNNVGPFEIEVPFVPQQPQSPRTQRQRHRCVDIFPLEACACCPPEIVRWTPKQWHYFQGWLHICLVVGVLGCTGLTVDAIISIIRACQRKDGTSPEKNMYYIQEILNLMFIVPCLYYFVHALGQYDDDLHKKKVEAEAARQKLIDSYLQTVNDMDKILEHATEINAGFAERGFETKRRDFLKFLERWQSCFGAVDTEQQEGRKLLEQTKRFCINWFVAFAECSIDPIGAPNLVVSQTEMDRCRNVDEVCTLCMERLRVAEVLFISARQEHDEKDIDDSRDRLKRASNFGKLIEESTQQARLRRYPWTLAADITKKGIFYLRGMSWLAFGCRRKEEYQLQDGVSKDGFPRIIPFGIGILVILSREHMILLCAWFFGWVLLVLEIILPGRQKKIIACTIITEICIIVTLIRFEKIDILQRLVRESRLVEKEKEAVRLKHENMKKFWNRAMQYIDLWLHRTTGQLDVFSEIHGRLEDIAKNGHNSHALEGMAVANRKLEELQSKLGPLEAWCHDGQLSDASKRRFDQAIASLCKEQQYSGVMKQFDDLLDDLPKMLPGLPLAIES